MGAPIFSLLYIRALPLGEWWVFWILLMVWGMDIGGYFAGKLIGGPKLLPKISPKKTWAGLVGGIVLAIVINEYIYTFVSSVSEFEMAITKPQWWICGLIAIWSQVGDMVESAIKRHFSVKDTSGLIPGHGGLLDRVDGLVFVAPIVAIWLYL